MKLEQTKKNQTYRNTIKNCEYYFPLCRPNQTKTGRMLSLCYKTVGVLEEKRAVRSFFTVMITIVILPCCTIYTLLAFLVYSFRNGVQTLYMDERESLAHTHTHRRNTTLCQSSLHNCNRTEKRDNQTNNRVVVVGIKREREWERQKTKSQRQKKTTNLSLPLIPISLSFSLRSHQTWFDFTHS